MSEEKEIDITITFHEDDRYSLYINHSCCWGSGTLGEIVGSIVERILEEKLTLEKSKGEL